MIADHIRTALAKHYPNTMRDTALACAKRGWPVYPMFGIKNGKCTCGFEHPEHNNGAHPHLGFSHLDASCDPATIIKWFDKWPGMNFGVATHRKQDGRDTVLTVLEVPADRPLDNDTVQKVMAAAGADFSTYATVLTPKGTRHVYVEVADSRDHDFTQIKSFKVLKCDEVMGAGSLHYSGTKYVWEGEPLPTIPVIAASGHLTARFNMEATAVVVNTLTAAQAEDSAPTTGDAVASAEPASAPADFRTIAQTTTTRMAANRAIAAEYMDVGFKLCRVANGSKGPKTTDWQHSPITIEQVNHEGLGLIHALSGTCAIDLDNFESAVAWFEAHNIDLRALLEADDAVQIKSGRLNRGKLLYRLPPGVVPLELFQVKHHDDTMLIEFRSASAKGCQDVLPPTIHPGTGKPYEWGGAGDFKNLPTLPPAVQALWLSLLATKSAMQPQAVLPAAAGSRSIAEGGRNNALYKLAGNMAGAGCSPESIRAALLVENRDRCKPPLPDHEIETIAKSAATNSYGAKEAARSAQVDELSEEALELAKKAVEEEIEQVGSIETVAVSEMPVVMRDIADWNARTARTVQPAFALCTALAACASVLARDFVGAGGSYTNLYITAVGPTASGKENALDTVSKIIDAYDWTRRAGKPASDSGVLTIMNRNPASTLLIDELGEVMQSVFDPSAASHQARIGTVLMELYTKGGKNYRGTEYAMQEVKSGGRPRGDVFSPCPSIFGATTATTLYKGLSYEAIHSGFLPRILVFRASDQIPMPNVRCEQVPMPNSVEDWMGAIKDRVEEHAKAMQKQGDMIGAGNSQHMPISVPFSPTAQALYEQAMVHVVDRRNASNDELESNMLSRLVENTCRVALTLALAADPGAIEVGAEHWKLALSIVTQATNAFMADIRANLFDSKHAKIEALAYKQIVKFFKENSRPISERTLVDRCISYRAAAPKDREQTIKALEAQGKITKQSGRNANTVLYLPRG